MHVMYSKNILRSAINIFFFSNLDCPECVHAMDLAIVNFFTCADPENPPGWGWDDVSEAYFW